MSTVKPTVKVRFLDLSGLSAVCRDELFAQIGNAVEENEEKVGECPATLALAKLLKDPTLELDLPAGKSFHPKFQKSLLLSLVEKAITASVDNLSDKKEDFSSLLTLEAIA